MPGRTVPPVIGQRSGKTGNLPKSTAPRTVNGLNRPVIGGRPGTGSRVPATRRSGIGEDGVFGRRASAAKPGQRGVRIARPKSGGEALNRAVIRGAKGAPGLPPRTGRKRDQDDEKPVYGDGPMAEFWSVEGTTRSVITNGYTGAEPVHDPGPVVPLTGEPKPPPVHDPGPAVVTSRDPDPDDHPHDPGPVAFGARRRPDPDWF